MAIKLKPKEDHGNYHFSEKGRMAIAHLALEGIYPTPEVLADMALFDQGMLTEDELIEKTHCRKV